jgi:hypothetical protein
VVTLRPGINAVAYFCACLAIALLCSFIYIGGIPGDRILPSLLLVGIELFAGAAITLLIVERALNQEARGIRSQYALHARDFLYSSLAHLAVFAYMRIIKDDIGEFPPSQGDDSRLSNLYFFGGKVGAIDDMNSVVKELNEFSSSDFILGENIFFDSALQNERCVILVERLKRYIRDTSVIRRNLPAFVDRVIQTSEISDIGLLYQLEGLRFQHEVDIDRPLETVSDAIGLYSNIANFLDHVATIYADLERMKSSSASKIVTLS